MAKIALLDDYQNVAREMADWSVLGRDAEITVFNDHIADMDDLADRLSGFEIVGVMRERTPFPRALFERLGALRLLVTTGMRNAAIDVEAAAAHGVTVAGTRGQAHPTAELTWGLILALLRHIPHEDRSVRAGGWQTRIGHDLKGRRLGVLGLGRLGAQVARVGLAFGMEVIAWSQNLTEARARECGARLVSKDELLREADIVTIHLILSARTRNLIGPGELGAMKSTAFLVNTSRGPIVDETALADVLSSGAIAGAGLDVFDVEPLPLDHPFRRLENVVVTPHVGYVSEDTYKVFYEDMVEDIRAWLAGAPIRVIEPVSK